MKYILCFLTCFWVLETAAQKLQRSTMGMGGGTTIVTHGSETYYMSSSIGQRSVIGSFAYENFQLRQGFQQPPITIVSRLTDVSEIDAVVFPNPVVSVVTVSLSEAIQGTIENTIFDVTGKEIFTSSKTDAQSYQLNLSSLPVGTYLLVVNANGREFSTRLIKN